jgi:hypothetical protein
MHRRGFTFRGIFISLFVGCLLAQAGLGFAHAQIGDVLEPVLLPDVEGQPHPFIGEAEVNVFILFHPQKPHSKNSLRKISEVIKRWSDHSVEWTAILSDRFPANETRDFFEEADLEARILIDRNDDLFGSLGVALYPVIGIADKNHVLRHYLPFRKVNYPAIIDAAIREVLGEIDKTAFEKVLNNPESSEDHASLRKKGAQLGLANELIERGRLQEARAQVLTHLENWPDDPKAVKILSSIDELLSDQNQSPE